MADYNWDMKSGVGGYQGEENKPVSTDNGYQDESGTKEGNDDQRTGERFQDAPEGSTDHGDVDSGVRGSKSGYGASSEGAGAHDRAPYVQCQFGLGGTTKSYGTEGSDPHLGEANTSSRADPRASASDQTTASGEDGWRPEDLIHTQGSKKHGLMTKIKEMMPSHHDRAAGATTDPKGASTKSMKEKIKEKLPGHHGNDAGM